MQPKFAGYTRGAVALVVVVGLVTSSFGCATGTPRYIEGVDSAEDQVTFLYKEQTEEGGWERGVIRCDLEDDELRDCRPVDVEFEAW